MSLDPDMPRQVAQARDDIEALYELQTVTNEKLDTLGEHQRYLADRINAVGLTLGERINAVGLTLGERINAVGLTLGERVDGVERALGERVDGAERALG
ncbi:MAG: hypothetical protein JO100_13255, partial [Pseudonocardia sp.]|nr:hypothetical protein [Pseudonocardia sp.]